MDPLGLKDLIKNNPTLELLRAQHAALILDFLWQAYRERGEVVRSQSWLEQQLADLLEDSNAPSEQKEAPAVKARRYLSEWCDRQFLRNYMDDQRKEMQYVLTSHTEKAFQIVDLLQERQFVGTESRFQDILSKLNEMVRYGQMDTPSRIQELEAQRAALDTEIQTLKAGNAGFVLEDYQIRSRYNEVLRLIGELTGDFSEVEENFRTLNRQIYHQHAQGAHSSGQILHSALDATQALRESDQGKSFYVFWNFLNDTHSNENLRQLTTQVHGILQERQLDFSENALRHLKRTLYSAGQRVVDSNEQLARKLVQIISEKNLQERQRTLALMRDIRQTALTLIEHAPGTEVGLSLEQVPPWHLPLERKLRFKPAPQPFTMTAPAAPRQDYSTEDLQTFYNPWLIQRPLLKQRLQHLLAQYGELTLPQILQYHPLEKGLPELLSWLSFMQTETCRVDDDTQDKIRYGEAPERCLHVPHIIFTAKAVSEREV